MTTYEQLSRCFWSWLTKKIRMWSTPPALNSSSWINKSKRSMWQVHQSIGSWVTQRWRLGKWHGCSWKGRVIGWKDVKTLPAAWFKPSGFWRSNSSQNWMDRNVLLCSSCSKNFGTQSRDERFTIIYHDLPVYLSQVSYHPSRLGGKGVRVVGWFGRGELIFLRWVKSDVNRLALIEPRSPGSLKWSNWEEGAFKRWLSAFSRYFHQHPSTTTLKRCRGGTRWNTWTFFSGMVQLGGLFFSKP